MVRSTATFGYGYPEVMDWKLNGTDLLSSVKAKVNALYNPNPTGPSKRRSGRVEPRIADIAEGFSGITFELAKDLGINNLNMQWTISIQLQRFAYHSTFIIDFFMGDPPADPACWSSATNLVGSHAQFVAADVSSMHPEGAPKGLLHGEVSLTHTLAAGVARGLLADLTPASVLPLLERGLTWRARASDNCEIDVDQLSDLSIAVGSRQVQPAKSVRDFPIYGPIQFHPEAVRGKVGGAR